MARIYEFAQKEYTIESEAVTISTRTDALFTCNGKQVALATGGQSEGIISFPVTAAQAITAAQPLATVTLTGASTLDGISRNGNNIQITKPGIYCFFPQFNMSAVGTYFVQILVDGAQSNGHTQTCAATIAGVEIAAGFGPFDYYQADSTTHQISFKVTASANVTIDVGEITVTHTRLV